MNIYLIGFMGSGKTTVSEKLGERLGIKVIDTDCYIEKKEGRTIKDIFKTEGEDVFRDMETDMLKELDSCDDRIVSCGGGMVLRSVNVRLMKKNGKVVLLDATAATIYERVRYSTNRPVLNGNMNIEYISSLMEKRRAAYENAADIVVHTDNKNIDKIVDEIIDKCKNR